MSQPNPTNELPPNPACETLTVRSGLTVGGVPITGETGIALKNAGVVLAGGPFTTLNLAAGLAAVNSGGGEAAVSTSPAVVFDTVASATNLRGNQAAVRSPIDNTKSRIVNLSSKTGTIAGAVGATANNATIAGGDDNSASNTSATVGGGVGNVASGQISTVTGGQQNVASGFGARASGFQCLSSGTVSDAHGNQCTASADYAVALGSGNVTSAAHGFTAGSQNTNTSGAVVGQQNTNTGADSFVWGTTNNCSIHDSEAGGIQADASRLQKSYACGSFDLVTKGQAQTTELVYRGVTPGAAPSESVVLLSSTLLTQDGPRLQDNKAYVFRVHVIVGGIQAGPTNLSRRFVVEFTAQRIAGVTVITGFDDMTGPNPGSAALNTATFLVTVGAAPDRLVMTFTTPAVVATASKVTAFVRMTEVAAF